MYSAYSRPLRELRNHVQDTAVGAKPGETYEVLLAFATM